MQNWEVLQEKISKMKKEEFIDFIIDNFFITGLEKMLKTKIGLGCEDCRKYLLEEYQPPKQEKWIVHRTLRTENKETYIGVGMGYDYVIKLNACDYYNATYDKGKAIRYDKQKAIEIRDRLNDDRMGKQYLWVISKVEE